MSKAQAGRLGGMATKSRHGSGFYSRIGKKGGSPGGRATLSKYGRDHFARIGAKGGRAKASRGK